MLLKKPLGQRFCRDPASCAHRRAAGFRQSFECTADAADNQADTIILISGAVMSISAIAGQSPAQLQSSQTNWQNILGAASSALGMSTSALQQQLQQGQSLATIAQSKGVSTSSLVSSIAGALQQNGQVPGASAAKLQQIATNIVNRTPGTHGHHHHAGGGTGASGASGTAAILAALSTSDSSSSSSASGAISSALSYSADGSSTPSSSSQPGSSFSLLA
jgi:hypothetical protein